MLSKHIKYSATILLALLAMMALATALTAFAQDEEVPPEEIPQDQFPDLPGYPPPELQSGTVILASNGGTTDPPPGQYNYPNGTVFTITAIPFEGYKFLYCVISGQYTPGHNLPPVILPDINISEEDPAPIIPALPNPQTANWDSLITSLNPLTIVCGYGYVFQYQPIFVPTTTTPPFGTAVVVILEGVGGSTNPSPGVYTFAEGQSITLTATPDEGQEFQYWIASGKGATGAEESTIILDNPLTFNCGVGYTYEYQPVFVEHPVEEQGAIPVIYWYIAIIVLAIIAVIGIALAVVFRGKAKK